MGKSQRDKGKRWEQAVARMFREAMPGVSVRRGWQSRSGSDAPDVEVPKWWVECKSGKMPNPRAALRQAVEATDGRTPVAVIKDDRQEPFVAMRLADFLELVREVGS